MNKKKLYYKLEADDYITIMDLSGCFAWIETSCEDIKAQNLFDEKEEDMPQYVITPVWMTEEDYKNLPEAD